MSYSYTWTYLESNPKQSKRLIGINYENFIQLIQIAKKINEIHQESRNEDCLLNALRRVFPGRSPFAPPTPWPPS